MRPYLSIVIPCYNCEQTLDEAVSSCYTQNINVPFEIIIVDDASIDNTKSVIKKLQDIHPEIKAFFQEKNSGGGATRNNAISHSSGDIVFCLDSDDILPPDTINRMLKFQEDNKLDGTVFSGSISFKKNTNRGTFLDFKIPKRYIKLEDVFTGKSWGVGANFMYRRNAYEKSGGYPEYHNFDTQGFGVRFLMSGNKVMVCPDSYFYQRQFTKNFSYFERSYNNGELSIGNYFILREIFEMLSDEAKEIFIRYPIFKLNILGSKKENIYTKAISLHSEKRLFKVDNGMGTDEKWSHLEMATKYFLSGNYDSASIKIIDYTRSGGIYTENIVFEQIMYTSFMGGGRKMSDIINIIRNMNLSVIETGNRRKSLLEKIIRKISKYYEQN